LAQKPYFPAYFVIYDTSTFANQIVGNLATLQVLYYS